MSSGAAFWAEYIRRLIEETKYKLGLTDYTITLVVAKLPQDDFKMKIMAAPEYMDAVIDIDPSALDTGDEVDELVAHEMSHLMHWELHQVAEDLVILAANGNELLLTKFSKEVERAAELATTRWGKAVKKFIKDSRNENRH